MEKWVLKNKKADFPAMMEQYKISEVIARLLVNRNQETEEDIKAYLNPELNRLHNPLEMKDLNKACDILVDKISQGKKIRIVGDYDVDGVAATYVLYTALLKCKAAVDYEIPDRIKDGYGINMNIIDEAYRDGIDTILTCDNGIAAWEQTQKAKKLGMTVIITDHHDIPYSETAGQKEYLVPEADAVVNPKQPDCCYPFQNLCGAAVAFKLVQVLYDRFGINTQEAEALLEIVAIATVCDVMELINENRIIVKHGLKLLKQTGNYGLKALLEKNNINLSSLSAYHLGYIIGPCLNASGRLDTAKKGLGLLLSATEEEADKLAGELKQLNDVRKEMTVKGLEQAVKLVEESNRKSDKVLVVYLKDCHESLAGIIAGRLRERYNKPAIVLTDSEVSVKGSCRSIEQCNIYEELSRCRHLLLKYGGHPLAAGLSLEETMVEQLREEINQNSSLTEEDFIPKISIDILLPLGYLSEDLIQELELMEPFGKGNIKPIFAEKNLRVRRAFVIGKNSNVLKLNVVNDYGRVMEALYFGDVEAFLELLSQNYGQEEVDKMFQNRENRVKLSVTYYPGINEYGGNRTVQIVIQNYQIVK